MFEPEFYLHVDRNDEIQFVSIQLIIYHQQSTWIFFVVHVVPSSPSGVRNYLKEALVNIITVHAEVQTTCTLLTHHEHKSNAVFTTCVFSSPLSQVFTVSKDLVPRVLSKIVESVADEMCRLMQCVSSFSKNGALQVHTDTQHTHTHSKTLTHKWTPTVVGDLPVVSDKAVFQFELPTADS